MESKLAKQLRVFGIPNNYYLVKQFGVKPNDIWIEWGNRRAAIYKVDSPVLKAFFGNKKGSMRKIEEAYNGDVEWVPSPFGGRIPSYVLAAAKTYVRDTDVDEFRRPKGMHEYRFHDNPEEERFAKWWGKLNKDHHTLAYLLQRTWDKATMPPEPPLMDARAAATVIQWLGSECGQAALRELGYVRVEPSKGR